MKYIQSYDQKWTWFVTCILLGIYIFPVSAQEKKPTDLFSNIERKAIENVVRDYIMKNPEQIINSLQRMRQQEESKKQATIKIRLKELRSELINDPDTPIGGNKKGSINIVEFFDYRCGYCKRVLSDLLKLINSDNDIRIVFKEFPILGPQSKIASKAGLAAWILDESKYQKFHNKMMRAKGAITKPRIFKLAADSGYNVSDLQKTMETPRIDSLLEKTSNIAKALDINGTPAFVIGDKIIRGAVDYKTLKNIISEMRKS